MNRMRDVPLRALVAVALALAPALPLAALGASPSVAHATSVTGGAHPSDALWAESTPVTPEPDPTGSPPPDEVVPPDDTTPDQPPSEPAPSQEPTVDPEAPPPTEPAPSEAPSPDITDPSEGPGEDDLEDEPVRPPGLPPAITQSTVPLLTIVIAAGVLLASGVILAVIIRRRARPVSLATPTPVRVPSTPAKETLDALVAVGEAMIDSGYPSNLVLDAVQDIATANEHPNAEIVVFPTALVITIVDDGATLTRAVSTGHSGYLLHQLDEIDQAVRTARDRPGSAPWVHERVRAIAATAAPFTRAQRIGAYVLVSASISVLLGASILGVALAGLLGAGVGTLLLLGERLASSYRVLVTVGTSLGVSLVVFAVARTALDPGVLPSLVAPLVILLPGALLTTGVIELATGHIMSGAARVAAGAMRLLLLAVGIVAAGALIGVPSVQLAAAAEPLGPIAPWVAVAVFGVGISINQCARPRSIGWIVLVLYVAYGAQVFGDVFFGGVLSALVGAAVVTPVAVVVAKQLAGPPAIVSFLPAFWLLVPGTLGLVGVTAVLDGDATGASTIVTTISTMIAIALGVLIGLASTSSLRRRSRNLN